MVTRLEKFLNKYESGTTSKLEDLDSFLKRYEVSTVDNSRMGPFLPIEEINKEIFGDVPLPSQYRPPHPNFGGDTNQQPAIPVSEINGLKEYTSPHSLDLVGPPAPPTGPGGLPISNIGEVMGYANQDTVGPQPIGQPQSVLSPNIINQPPKTVENIPAVEAISNWVASPHWFTTARGVVTKAKDIKDKFKELFSSADKAQELPPKVDAYLDKILKEHPITQNGTTSQIKGVPEEGWRKSVPNLPGAEQDPTGKVTSEVVRIMNMPAKDRAEMIVMAKAGNVFNIPETMSGDVGTTHKAIDWILSQQDKSGKHWSTERLSTLAGDIIKMVPEFAVGGEITKGLIGTAPKAASLASKAAEAGTTFGITEALKVPRAGESVAQRAESVKNAALTGAVVGGVSKVLPKTIVRAPALVAGFAGKAYHDTIKNGGTRDQAIDNALESGGTIAIFELLGLGNKAKEAFRRKVGRELSTVDRPEEVLDTRAAEVKADIEKVKRYKKDHDGEVPQWALEKYQNVNPKQPAAENEGQKPSQPIIEQEKETPPEPEPKINQTRLVKADVDSAIASSKKHGQARYVYKNKYGKTKIATQRPKKEGIDWIEVRSDGSVLGSAAIEQENGRIMRVAKSAANKAKKPVYVTGNSTGSMVVKLAKPKNKEFITIKPDKEKPELSSKEGKTNVEPPKTGISKNKPIIESNTKPVKPARVPAKQGGTTKARAVTAPQEAKPEKATIKEKPAADKPAKIEAEEKKPDILPDNDIVFRYQDEGPEKVIHSGKWKSLDLRMTMEMAGDILRETSQTFQDKSYLFEKLRRIKDTILDREVSFSTKHMFGRDDPELARLKEQYDKQPVMTNDQKKALALIKSLIDFPEQMSDSENMRKSVIRKYNDLVKSLLGDRNSLLFTEEPAEPNDTNPGKKPEPPIAPKEEKPKQESNQKSKFNSITKSSLSSEIENSRTLAKKLAKTNTKVAEALNKKADKLEKKLLKIQDDEKIEPKSTKSSLLKKTPVSKNIVVGKETKIHVPEGKSIPSRYAIMSLADIVPSHSYNGTEAIKNDKYPASLQPRDYTRDKTERIKVMMHANEKKPEFFISNHPAADNGPPTVTKDGIVINGNGRAMTLKLANSKGGLGWYNSLLMKQLPEFGIKKEDIRAVENPILVRVVDYDAKSKEAAKFARMGNVSNTQAQSILHTANSLSGMIDQNITGSLVLDEDSTFSEAVVSSKGRSFRKQLYKNIPSSVVNLYFKPDSFDLNEAGKSLVRNMLLTKVFPVDTIAKLSDERKGLARSLENAVPQLLQAKEQGEVDVVAPLTETLDFLNRNPDIKTPGDVERVLGQGVLFGEKEKLSPEAKVLMQFIIKNMNKARKFKKGLSKLLGSLRVSTGLLAAVVDSPDKLVSEALDVPFIKEAFVNNRRISGKVVVPTAEDLSHAINQPKDAAKAVASVFYLLRQSTNRIASMGGRHTRWLGESFHTVTDMADDMEGEWKMTARDIFRGMSIADILKVNEILKNEAPENATQKHYDAAEKVFDLTERIGKVKENAKLIRPDGKPFKARKNMFPQVFSEETYEAIDKQKGDLYDDLVDWVSSQMIKKKIEFIKNEFVPEKKPSSDRTAQAKRFLRNWRSFDEGKAELERLNMEMGNADSLMDDVEKPNPGWLHRRMFEYPARFMEKNPHKVLDRFINSSSRRIAEHKIYGNKYKNLKKAITRGSWEVRVKARNNGKLPERKVKEFIELTRYLIAYENNIKTLKSKLSETSQKALRAGTSATAAIHLFSLYTGGKNVLWGGVSGFIRYGHKMPLKMAMVFANPKMIRRAKRAGVLEHSGVPEISGEGLGKSFAKVTGSIMAAGEVLLRTASSHAAEVVYTKAIKSVHSKVIPAKNNPKLIEQIPKWLIRELTNPDVGFRTSEIVQMVRDGEISDAQKRRFMRAGSKMTQFQARAKDLPALWATDLGRFVTQFMSMAYKHTQNVFFYSLKELGYKNPMPLARMMVAIAIGGYGFRYLRRMFRGEELNEWETKDIIRLISDNLGLIDTAVGVATSPTKSMAAERLVPAPISTATGIYQGAKRVIKAHMAAEKPKGIMTFKQKRAWKIKLKQKQDRAAKALMKNFGILRDILGITGKYQDEKKKKNYIIK